MDKETLVKEVDKLLKDPVHYSSAWAINRAYELGYVAGQAMERRLLRLKLGLGVPSDSEDGCVT